MPTLNEADSKMVNKQSLIRPHLITIRHKILTLTEKKEHSQTTKGS